MHITVNHLNMSEEDIYRKEVQEKYQESFSSKPPKKKSSLIWKILLIVIILLSIYLFKLIVPGI